VTRRPGTIVGIDHVQIPIPEGGEDEVRRFYVELLGLTEVPKPAPLAARGGVWLAGPGVALHFGVEGTFRPWTKAHVALLVDDLGALRAWLEANGVATTEETAPVGVRRCHCIDPFGNRLELVDVRDGGFTVR
jgi:catechol 2,3-dioxygenase-like lactoylglutathione lyase family enzyme